MEKGRGVVIDVLVKWGILSVGDAIVVNTSYGRVRSLMDETGKSIKSAGPSTPVRITGLKAVPVAGQELLGTQDESKARKIAERRQKLEDTKRINDITRRAKELEDSANPVVIRVILKADSIGGLNALRNIVDGLAERADEVGVHVIGASVGEVTPGDVNLASMSEEDGQKATILGFNVKEPTGSVRTLVKQHDVTVIQNDVVYRLEEALEAIMVEHMPEERHLTVEVSLSRFVITCA
jgi:translation initiation factor IF-2